MLVDDDDGASSPRLLRLLFLPVAMLPFAACAAISACVPDGKSRVPAARASGVVWFEEAARVALLWPGFSGGDSCADVPPAPPAVDGVVLRWARLLRRGFSCGCKKALGSALVEEFICSFTKSFPAMPTHRRPCSRLL